MNLIFLTSLELVEVVLLVAGVLGFIAGSVLQGRTKRVDHKKLLKETDVFFSRYGLEAPGKEDIEEHKTTLSTNELFLGHFADLIQFKRCYKKSSGDVDYYLSNVLVYWLDRVRKQELHSGDMYWNFYCTVKTRNKNELAIYHRERTVPEEVFGSRLKITNAADDFDRTFVVKSTDRELKETEVPEEIQKILLDYKDQYPVISSEMTANRAYVFIGKNGFSVTAPYNEDNDRVMTLFELGAELAEYFKGNSLQALED